MTIMYMTAAAKEKRTTTFSFRMDPDLGSAIEELAKEHGASDRSEYFRGLVYLDALLSGFSTLNLDKPRWVSKVFPHLFTEKIVKRQEETAKAKKRVDEAKDK